MSLIPVTVKCLYCRREIDGHFMENDKSKIVDINVAGKVKAEVGEWNKKKGYIHLQCKTGIEAEEALNSK